MLKPTPMSKISVFGSRSDMEFVIEELHNLKLYHIKEHKARELDIGNPLERAEAIATSLISAKSMLAYWHYKETHTTKLDLKQVIDKITNIDSKHRVLAEKNRELTDEITSLEQSQTLANQIKKLGVEPGFLSLNSVKGFIGTIKNDNLEELKSLKDYELKVSEKQIALFVPTEKADEALKLLQNLGFSQLDLSKLENEDASKTKQRVSKLQLEKNRIEKEINQIKNANKAFLASAVEFLEAESDKAEVPLKFAVSENTFLISGFVPTKQLPIIDSSLERVTNGRIDIQVQELDKQEQPPIKLNNPGPVGPFEFLMDLYALPTYKEIDPTLLTFITFPILFGFMLGDMGYGVVTLVLFLVLKKFFPVLKRLLNILVLSSLWTIVFGALFGEIFGEEIIFGYDLPRVLSRLHQINDLLMISLAIGAVHLNFGLLLGFYNEYKSHGFKTAVLEKASWFVLELSAIMLALSYMNIAVPLGINYVLSIPIWAGYVVLILAIYMLYAGEGIKGIIELPSIFSNILSYARLMAIGLASASLAIVVNQFAKDFFAMGWVGIIPAILILVAGHTINIALGILGPFLHSLRLHYVEFFTKFYKGGGKRFVPFGIEGGK